MLYLLFFHITLIKVIVTLIQLDKNIRTIIDIYQGLKSFLIKLVVGSSRSRKIFKTGIRLSFNFDIMVTETRFNKDISKTKITVNRLKADDEVFW
jgi:hypothetical protein